MKIVLIDGHSILNRAYYGVPMLTNSEGLHTNAVYGFLNIMLKILDEEKPDYLAVAFDRKEPTFRHKMYAQYKGTRKPMPEELHEQVPVIKEVLTAMGIEIVEKAGYEADDILGTIAKRSEKKGMEVSLVSGDRDLLQIASEHIKIRVPKTRGNRTEIFDYYADDVKEAYQVTPEQFIELKALMGDASDNIPGVPKVGEKTATQLMVTYGSIDSIYEHLDEITKKGVKASLAENRELAELSKKLATIDTDADIDFSYEKAKMGDLFTPEAYEIFKKLSFKNMLAHFEIKEDIEEKPKEEEKLEIVSLTTQEDLSRAVSEALESGMAAIRFFYIEEKSVGEFGAGQGGQMFFQLEDSSEHFGCLFCAKDSDRIYFAEINASNGIAAPGMTKSDIIRCIEPFLDKEGFVLNCFDIKNDFDCLFSKERKNDTSLSSHELTKNLFDCKIAAYLINPLKSDYGISDVAAEYLDGMAIKSYAELFGKADMQSVYSGKKEELIKLLAAEVRVLALAGERLSEALSKKGMAGLFRELEMPLTYVLYDMEREGITVKPEELKAYGEALSVRIDELEQTIYEEAGEEFNLNSPMQLGDIFFDKMKMPGAKKTRRGYSTAADVLEKLAPDYPIVRDVLEYRGLAKLKSTYADGLSAFIGDDSKIHTSFNQTIVATGRLSSTDPNLQNIPMRTELGRRIRKLFVPQDGCVFIDADYSQIELRVLAHMSGDEQLIEAYKQDADIHRITASKVFNTPFDEVTDLQRRNAKAVNFGIVYGISSFGLSQDLSISPKEAKVYIDEYFKTYPGIKSFLDRLVSDAKQTGYAKTLFGRKRPVPELKSSNYMQRSFGERVAMNSPIQGTAADIIKRAMLNVFDALRKGGFKSKLILQIHDELLVEARLDEADEVQQLLEREMKNACELAVQLETDVHSGMSWYDTK